MQKNNLFIIEDASQAHGSLYQILILVIIVILQLSVFYPAKNLGAIGEGGAIVTDSKKIYDRIKKLRAGHLAKIFLWDWIQLQNARILAISLLIKLKFLSKDIKKRAKIASIYKKN